MLHIIISYHKKTREAVVAGIAHPIKMGGVDNFADVLTKAQTLKCFSKMVRGFMHGGITQHGLKGVLELDERCETRQPLLESYCLV
jgi:hypothetical protein